MGTSRKQASQPQRRSPESLRLRALTAALTVANLQASIRWYCDIVGFTVDETWAHGGLTLGAALKAGTTVLMLSQDDDATGSDRIKGDGVRFYLSTAQNVDQIAAEIKARGGTLASEPTDQPWGARSFGLIDPDGYRLTFTSIT